MAVEWKIYEDLHFTAGTTELLLNDDLGSSLSTLVFICDGPGDVMFTATSEGNPNPPYPDPFRVYAGEEIRFQRRNLKQARIGFLTDSAYRCFISATSIDFTFSAKPDGDPSVVTLGEHGLSHTLVEILAQMKLLNLYSSRLAGEVIPLEDTEE